MYGVLMEIDYEERATQLTPIVRDEFSRAPFMDPHEGAVGTLRTKFTISKVWDSDFTRQCWMALHLTGMAMRDIHEMVTAGGGDPSKGFTIEPFSLVTKPIPGVEDARYVGTISWAGPDFNVHEAAKGKSKGDKETRAEMIRRYLDES